MLYEEEIYRKECYNYKHINKYIKNRPDLVSILYYTCLSYVHIQKNIHLLVVEKCKTLNNEVPPQWQKQHKRTKGIVRSQFQAAGPSLQGVTAARSWRLLVTPHPHARARAKDACTSTCWLVLISETLRQWLPTVGYLPTSTNWDSSHRRAHRSSKCRLTLHEDSFPGESTSEVTTEGDRLSFPVPSGHHQPPLALIFTCLFCCSWILSKDLGAILFTLSSQHFTLLLT